MVHRFYPFCYYQKERDLRGRPFETQIHKIRDGLALSELAGILMSAGFVYGGAVLNIPRSQQGPRLKVVHTLPTIRPKDVVLLATRPPLDDNPAEPQKRWISRSDLALE